MKDLSLYMLDIAQNSIAAQAVHLDLTLVETSTVLTLTVKDDGFGMSPALLAQVTDPFTTTRSSRKTGMGLPLLRMAAELTGGTLTLESQEGQGTCVTAVFHVDHINCVPVGDMGATLALLVQGSPHMALTYTHSTPAGVFCFDTAQLRETLGEVPLDNPEVVLWVRDYVQEQEVALCQGAI